MDDYSTILNRMKENYSTITGYTPSDVSDTGIRLRVYASEILECMLYAKWLENQIFIQTATGDNLDKHALEYGITRLQGTKAIGTVKFTISEAISSKITIPAKTELLNGNGISYLTDSIAFIEAGQTQVSVNITAALTGSSGNAGIGDIHTIGKNNIQVIGVAIKNIISVTNEQPIRGGTDTENDEYLRKRIINAAEFPSTGCNATYYKNLAASVSGVRSASLVRDAQNDSIIHMFLGGNGGTVTSDTVASVQVKLQRLGQIGIEVVTHPATEVPIDINIYISVKTGYAISDLKAQCKSCLEEYLGTRSAGEKITKNKIIEKLAQVEGLNEVVFDSQCVIPNITESQMATVGTITINEI